MKLARARLASVPLILSLALLACGGPPSGNTDAGDDAGFDAGVDAGFDAGSPYTAECTSPTSPACQDEAILALDLKKNVAAGLITSSAIDGGFVSVVDATAGAVGTSAPTDSYVYGKFTPTGLTKVMVTDEQALDSMDWDIAFRRFVVRLNGGSSGPSCVGAAAMPLGAMYEGLVSVPTGAVFGKDGFYTGTSPSCVFVADNSGLTTSPSTALSDYYAYTGCVEMSGRVYVVRTAEGRSLKLSIDAYYFPMAAQTYCNTNHNKQTGSTSASLSLRWSFLD